MLERELDPARARLVEAASERRIGLKELSAQLGRNHSYLQQYLVKGSPRCLPEAVRHHLAVLLDIPEAELRDGAPPPPPGPGNRPGSSERTVWPRAPAVGVPVVPADRLSEVSAPGISRLAPDHLAGSLSAQAVGVRLTEPAGLLQPRHIVICEPSEPTRVGDVVLVVEGERMVGIGLLATASHDQIAWDEPGARRQADRTHVRLWRVRAVLMD